MTLSRFLRDYLYITLGGNRKGQVRRYVNQMATMLLGGLWHSLVLVALSSSAGILEYCIVSVLEYKGCHVLKFIE